MEKQSKEDIVSSYIMEHDPREDSVKIVKRNDTKCDMYSPESVLNAIKKYNRLLSLSFVYGKEIGKGIEITYATCDEERLNVEYMFLKDKNIGCLTKIGTVISDGHGEYKLLEIVCSRSQFLQTIAWYIKNE